MNVDSKYWMNVIYKAVGYLLTIERTIYLLSDFWQIWNVFIDQNFYLFIIYFNDMLTDVGFDQANFV